VQRARELSAKTAYPMFSRSHLDTTPYPGAPVHKHRTIGISCNVYKDSKVFWPDLTRLSGYHTLFIYSYLALQLLVVQD
jgi:hypothetical protein